MKFCFEDGIYVYFGHKQERNTIHIPQYIWEPICNNEAIISYLQKLV
jgi:hypothetical protein